MTDPKHGTNPPDASHRSHRSHQGHPGHPSPPIDAEIDVRRAIEVALWLIATTIGTLVVGYFIYRGLAKWTADQDPAPSALTEANRRMAPPAPNLQIQPEKELAAMRAAEQDRLTTWGWTDKALGLAHMPIADAINRLAVPEPTPAAIPAAPAAPALPAPVTAATPTTTHAGSAH